MSTIKLTRDEKKLAKYLENPWLFNGKPFLSEHIGDNAGFVYRITDEDGKMYIGRKYFFSMRKVDGRKNRKKVPSDWMTYFSSNDEIKAYKKTGKKLTREIISLHETEGLVNYYEVSYQFSLGVLTSKDSNGNSMYYNDNIQGRFFSWQYNQALNKSTFAE